MNPPRRFLTRLAFFLVGLGVLFLFVAGVTYALGYNEGPGRAFSNVVPGALFAGVTLLILGWATVIADSPESLPRTPERAAIWFLALIALILCGAYVWQMGGVLGVRADIVNWSEGMYLDHVIRLRAGVPQFSPPDDANSNVYPPGAPLLTYRIARFFGYPTSIPAFRFIQQIYILIAVLFAAAATRELLRLAAPDQDHPAIWLCFWIPCLYIVATNPVTNAFIHTLHNDALALLVNGVAVWLLIRYLRTENNGLLILMALLPALGYLVKQKEAVWIFLYVLCLVFVGRTEVRRTLGFAASAVALLLFSVGFCVVLWGRPFTFWTFQTLGSLHVSLREALAQVTEAAWYVLPGFVGGVLLLRRAPSRKVLAAWVCWLLLLISTIYTSGVAFRPAHLGPASVLASIWVLAGLATIWPRAEVQPEPSQRAEGWFQSIVYVAIVSLLLLSYGNVQRGSVPRDLERYIAEIEREFLDLPPDRVLLDFGSWVYLQNNVVMKDRAGPMGVLVGTATGTFSATKERIENRAYDRILMRRVEKEDYYSWARGIREELARNYREVRVIRSPGQPPDWPYRYLLRDIIVLEPSPGHQAADMHPAPQPK